MRITKIPLIDRLLILGQPGIGKTEIIRSLAERESRSLGKVFVDLREAPDHVLEDIKRSPEKYYVFYRIIASHIFPEDLSFPRRVSDTVEYVKFIAPRELAILTIPGLHGVLFIDELTNLQRKDQVSMFFSLILEKELAWTIKLSKNIKIIAAGNPPEASSVANLLPAPLISRMTVVEVEPPSVAEWTEYMYARYPEASEMIAKAAAYLNYYKDDFVKPPRETETLENFPTPRNWSELVLLLHQLREADAEVVREVIVGRLGKDVGSRFYAFIRKQPPKLEDLLENPEIYDRLDIDTKIMAMAMLAMNHERLLRNGDKIVHHLATSDKDMLILLLLSMPKEARLKAMVRFKEYLREVARAIKDYV